MSDHDQSIDGPILLTGFPGFLSRFLVRKLVEVTQAPLHFLCLRSTVETARQQLAELENHHPALAGRWHVHSGNIAEPKLGLDPSEYDELTAEVGIVWHLAAIYDLSVAEETAYRVNVGGTVEILDFCENCEHFERLNYVSTCYVAGERTGTICEDELDVGQHHKNHYEETKFWAEVEVQRRSEDLPTAIYRPAIVVGDSGTGETAKYDGPYYVFQLLHRLPEWMPVPRIGRGDAEVNLVPVDFVAEALATLGHHRASTGAVYHLADPFPMQSAQIVDRVLEQMGRRPSMGRLPATWVERALKNRTVEEWTGVPREALTYFNHDAHFDTTNATGALDELGLQCPPLSTYLDRLLDYFLRHPDGPPSDQSSGQAGADAAGGNDSA